jgi:Ulp1 family protease
MCCLYDLKWIKDDIINYYMAMIDARDTREMEKRLLLPHGELNPPKRRIWCTNSFLMTKLNGGLYKDVKRWAKKAKLGGTNNSIFDLWRMVVPINIDKWHWTSVHVDFKTKEILYLDSLLHYLSLQPSDWEDLCTLKRFRQKYLKLVLNYLKDEHFAKFGILLDASKWRMKSLDTTIPQQQNINDCGVFTCTFATYATDTLVRGSGNSGSYGIPFDFGQSDMPYMRKRMVIEFDTAQNGKWFPWVPCSASLLVPLVIFCCVWNELSKSRRNKNHMIVVLWIEEDR